MSKKKKGGLAKDMQKAFGDGFAIGKILIKTYSWYVGLVKSLSSFLGSKILNKNWRIFSYVIIVIIFSAIGLLLFMPFVTWAIIKNFAS
jgi:hypothetical protein